MTGLNETGNGVREYGLKKESFSLIVSTLGAYVNQLNFEGSPVIIPSIDSKETHGGSTVLIPYANRVRNARYMFNGVEYKLPENQGKNSIHGFARSTTFDVVSLDESAIVLNAKLSNSGYPSELEVQIRYSLSGNAFNTEVEINNCGKKPAPVMAGFHPYFSISSSWSLETSERAEILEYVDQYFPSGKAEVFDFNSRGDLMNSRFDNCFRGGGTLKLRSGNRTITMKRRNFPYFVVYNGEYSRGISVALEPMTGAPDCYNNKIGLETLEPGERFKCSYELSIQ